ncbi:WNT6 protein, partial [Polypterus senegalus]
MSSSGAGNDVIMETSGDIINGGPEVTSLGAGNDITFGRLAVTSSSGVRSRGDVGQPSCESRSLSDETSLEAGIKVQIHSQDEPPYIHQLGFGVSPGFQTFVSCQEQRLTYLPQPWGKCRPTTERMIPGYDTYSISACRLKCEKEEVLSRCQCRMVHMPGNETICSPNFYIECADDALGDIGGQMGLFIGASLLTILEILDYIYEVIKDKIHRLLKPQKEQNKRQSSSVATLRLEDMKPQADSPNSSILTEVLLSRTSKRPFDSFCRFSHCTRHRLWTVPELRNIRIDLKLLWSGIVSLAVGSPLVMDPNSICRKTKRLAGKQAELCQTEPEIIKEVAKGAKLGVRECQFQFRFRRWNCTSHNKYFGKIVQQDIRETAFVYAITSAGVTHSVTQACSMGELIQCGCEATRSRAPPFPTSGPGADGSKWEWGGCGDDVEFGYEKSKQFMDAKRKKGKSDIRTLIDLHNNEAGRLVQ